MLALLWGYDWTTWRVRCFNSLRRCRRGGIICCVDIIAISWPPLRELRGFVVIVDLCVKRYCALMVRAALGRVANGLYVC